MVNSECGVDVQVAAFSPVLGSQLDSRLTALGLNVSITLGTKRGELRRLAATKNNPLNSSASLSRETNRIGF